MNYSLLSQYIQENDLGDERPQLLPFFHSCEGYIGEKIVKSQKLSVQYCKVFKRNLLYLFYGKPSYPVADNNKESRTDDFYCPVCFAVDPQKVEICRVFPFDTGAYKAGRYRQFIRSGTNLKKYRLNHDLDAILAYISVMFQNNRNYLIGKCCQEKSNLREIQYLLNMFNARGAVPFDERAITVEVISKKSLELADAVECIILPKSLLRNKQIYEFIHKNHLKYKTYNIRRLTAPGRYNEMVFQLVMEYIGER